MGKSSRAARQSRLDARAAQIKAQAERETRTRNIVIAVFVVLIVGGAGFLWLVTNPPAFLNGSNANAAAGPPHAVPDEGHNHVANGTQIAYKHQPPSSGDHYNSANFAPMPWGPYQQALLPGQWVHNLEHGGVVMVYKCSGSECDDLFSQAQDVFAKLPKKLEPVVPTAGTQQIPEVKFLSTPYQSMPPKIALLAWDEEQDLNSIDLATIRDFFNKYGDHGREDLP